METTTKEKFLIFNTLSSVPTLLKGKSVLIDLLNESSVAGRVEIADGFMNINLIDAVFIDRHGLQYAFDEFMVQSRCIRQIQIPESIDIGKKLSSMLEKVGKREPRSTRRTYKQKRATERHKQIVGEIIEKNKEIEK